MTIVSKKSTTTQRVVLVEGPDGGGKTTYAKALADNLGASYVHHGVYPRLGRSEGLALARFYAESMLPALLGLKPVVLDRAWPSEAIYGTVCRGETRFDRVTVRQLERLALRCGAYVVRCQPPDAVVIEAAAARSQYPTRAHLPAICAWYHDLATQTALPVIHHDYTREPTFTCQPSLPPCHPLNVRSAGSWGARVVLVGEAFADRTADDLVYQWPFGSLGNTGCSRWVTDVLDKAGISENQLLWVNADQDLSWLKSYLAEHQATAIALGLIATDTLTALAVSSISVPHPQHQKRFSASKPYNLIKMIKEHR